MKRVNLKDSMHHHIHNLKKPKVALKKLPKIYYLKFKKRQKQKQNKIKTITFNVVNVNLM